MPFEHGDKCRGRIVTEHLRNLLHVMAIYQRLQRQNQLKLVTPAAKTQPRFFNDQTGKVPLTHRKYAGPLSQRLPLRGLPAIVATILRIFG